ncbi:MAG: hypothetical protein Q8R00_04795 [Candidatus Nanoarchaeia archaeon]|nr:hypothetical protein [Candidatus Nanoarchaeia archaeon]
MVLSIFGVVFFGPAQSETFDYKGKTFLIEPQGGYSTRINDQKIIFLYPPSDLELIQSSPITFTQLQYTSKFYVSFNPQQDIGLALNEFNRLIIPLLGKRVVSACFEDVPGCEELPIITCEQATPETKVIVYEEANSSAIDYNLNCLTIKGSGEDLAKLTDKMALDFLIS